jgi:hypothetical protein
MAQFNLEDYEPVQNRIGKFLKERPNGRILTEIVSDLNNISTIIFKAYIYDGEILLSTGFAYEKEGNGYINKTSHVENCETSAIGRGLANIGYHGDKRPSREEVQKAKETEQPKIITYDQKRELANLFGQDQNSWVIYLQSLDLLKSGQGLKDLKKSTPEEQLEVDLKLTEFYNNLSMHKNGMKANKKAMT